MIYGIYKILEKIIKNNSVVSIFTDLIERSKCTVGYVCLYNDEEVLIKLLDENGEYDGYGWRKIEYIYRLDIDGLYENKLKMLYELKKQSNNDMCENIDVDNILQQILYFAKKNDRIIEISIDVNNEQELIVGLIDSIIDNETITINRVNTDGKPDGIIVINISDIVSLNCDTKDSRDLLLLRGGEQ